MTRLQESRIEEDMDRYMEFSFQVRDGEKSEAIAVRAMALYLKDTKGLSHHDKVTNQYFDKAEKKLKKEKTLETLMGRESSKRAYYSDDGSGEDFDMEEGDEVNSFRTGGGVLMARGAYGLPTNMFAPRIEDRILGYDLSRPVPKLQRSSKSKSCKLCGSKTHEEGECANTAQSRCGAEKHGMLSLQGHKCCYWIYLFEKNLVDKIGKPLQMKKKRKQ
jgi:hypothetical protein